MKKGLLFVLLFVLVSCSVNFDIPDTGIECCFSDGNDVVLSHELENAFSYSWYSCSDERKSNSIDLGVHERNFTVAGFVEKKTAFYYCVAEDSQGNTISSKVYCVFNSGLPKVYISKADGKRIETNFEYAPATFRTDSAEYEMEIKGRGHISWQDHPKKSYNLKFGEKVSLIDGIEESKRWCLLGCYNDPTMLGNWYASYLGKNILNKSNQWQVSYTPVDLFFNGRYEGCYLLGETIKLEKSRVDIQDIAKLKKTDKDVNKDGITDLNDGGFILEITCVVEDNSFNTLHGLSVVFKDPDLTDYSSCEGSWTLDEITTFIRKKVNTLEEAIYSNDMNQFKKYFDVDSFVDWYLLNEFLANSEADFETSVFVYYNPKKEKFYMGPNWDFDKSLCDKDGIQVLTERNTWFTQLMQNDDFVKKVQDRWTEVKSSIETESFPAVKGEFEKIKTSVYASGLLWGKDNRNPEYLSNLLDTWLPERLVFFDEHIKGLGD